MSIHALSDHFRYFFGRLNPSDTFETQAAGHYNSIKQLIEVQAELEPACFLQGSYKQATAIHTINDIDIVALCRLWHPPSDGGVGGRSWTRDEIFAAIAAPLLADRRYRDKVRYGPSSMCVKVDLGIKVEILPVVFKRGNRDGSKEPFRLFRPASKEWEDGYARYHQQWLSWKNRADKTGGNFIPAIKVVKHLRSIFGIDSVSFHIECLLFRQPDEVFRGAPADYIPAVLESIVANTADLIYLTGCTTPCSDRDIFGPNEWGASWFTFHEVAKKWAMAARTASDSRDRHTAIEVWQALLDESYFPAYA